MTGVANPPVVVKPFGANAVPPYINLPLPVASPGTPGRASWDTGYPATNMTPGGIPPNGADTQGLLYTLSAFCAMLQAGQCVPFNADAATAFGGYKVGAMLASSTPGLFWFNNLDGNTGDPDDGTPTGWIAWRPVGANYVAGAAAAGPTNNAAPAGFDLGTGTLDVTTSGGDAVWTGLVAGTEGQRVVITNVGASFSLTLSKLNGASLAANQFRCVADFTLLPGMTVQVQYSVGAGKWIVIP